MKVKRYKHVKKVLSFYRNNFALRPPYVIVLDGTFCKAALKFQVNISDQLPKYLDSEVKLCTTKCVLSECEALGSLLYGPLKVLQQCRVWPCGHGNPVTATKCLSKLAKKAANDRCFIGTQDPELSDILRQTPGTPLLFISHKTITLEAPSRESRDTAEGALTQRLAPSHTQKHTLDVIKKVTLGEPAEKPDRKRKRGPKGPNPMSCRKKKKAGGQGQVAPRHQQNPEEKKKRARKRRKQKPEMGGAS